MKKDTLQKLKLDKETEELFRFAIKQGKAQALEDELDFFEHTINDKHCGCDRCPSCRIMISKRIKEIKSQLEGEK